MALKISLKRTRQTAVKGRSSALIITIVIHVLILVAAATFVAVTVVQRSETKFEGKQIVRPKMKLKKLQVPVKIDKNTRQQSKVSQRVTSAARVTTKSVDFKMPEMTGLGGGAGVDLSGFSLGGSLGFASTQINVFGLKSTGEKIVFILDTSRNMLIDEIGGIPAYKIIKDELTGLIGRLPPTTLFNVIIFDANREAVAFSPDLCPASDANVQKLKTWLAPLNTDQTRIGTATLASPGTPLTYEPAIPIANIQRGWPAALSYALQKGADNIYWLGTFDFLMYIHKDLYADVKRGKPLSEPTGMPPEFHGVDYSSCGGKEQWDAKVAEARKLLDTENAQRKASGQPARVIPAFGGEYALVAMYFPGISIPQMKDAKIRYLYTAQDVIDYIGTLQKKYSEQDRRSVSIGLKKKKLSFNVIHFVPKDKDYVPLQVLEDVAQKMNGNYLRIQGRDAIKSSATSGQ
jgi:hypothetical protein